MFALVMRLKDKKAFIVSFLIKKVIIVLNVTLLLILATVSIKC